MFLSELKRYDKYIASYHISQFERNGNNLRFRIMIRFKDSSRLFIKEILIDGVKRKYGYQWINKNNELICRWDNAPDWPDIQTFPHHKHVGSEHNVIPSENIEFATIMKELICIMQKR